MREKSPGAAFAGNCWSCCCCCSEDASADGDAKKLPDGATTADMARARALRMAPIVAALGDDELRLLLLPMAVVVAVAVAVAVAVLVLLAPVADEPVVALPPDAAVGDNRGAAAAFDDDAAEPN